MSKNYKKQIFIIVGSASNQSANQKLVDYLANLTTDIFNLKIFTNLKTLPHFDPELSTTNPPQSILDFRETINKADGVIICTPEYVFSIPSGLKNVIEWCVSTTIFFNKPMGLITASAQGQKGHEELKLIMKTLGAIFTEDTALLIQGIKGKVNEEGQLIDATTIDVLRLFIKEFKLLL